MHKPWHTGMPEARKALMLRSLWDARSVTSATPYLRQCQVSAAAKIPPYAIKGYRKLCI